MLFLLDIKRIPFFRGSDLERTIILFFFSWALAPQKMVHPALFLIVGASVGNGFLTKRKRA